MKEYPEHLNTKQDYLNMLDYDKAETVKRLEHLLATRFHWVRDRELSEWEAGVEDETHTVYDETGVSVDDGAVIKKRYQYELQESEYSSLSSLGFSVEEVEQLIKENRDETV
ncbi:hypothetical protein ME1_00825 [Bartonella vinsonii subsp. arupensis OK-94-513]|uniref:Uncharacterized protein n=1 Tax=Bartonella vinsonii subsp. arupensis OK-94-513 TaxID=1094562 RepID=J0QQ32_BARVI|nr:hypothetical protein [Bartonella vinsonii]EJF87861.1 hypothetical protein ME1_00825 [Bartonella vinsonii subsp. arupensis OK-94-513]